MGAYMTVSFMLSGKIWAELHPQHTLSSFCDAFFGTLEIPAKSRDLWQDVLALATICPLGPTDFYPHRVKLRHVFINTWGQNGSFWSLSYKLYPREAHHKLSVLEGGGERSWVQMKMTQFFLARNCWQSPWCRVDFCLFLFYILCILYTYICSSAVYYCSLASVFS